MVAVEQVMASRQETFDIVVAHLVKQGVQSKRGGLCMYRGPGGTKCAAGILIPDDAYDARMERVGASVEGPHCPGTAILEAGYDRLLAVELQYIHDDDRNWHSGGLTERAHSLLAKLAKNNGLVYARPT